VLIPVAGDVGVGAEDREKRAGSLLDRLPDRIDAREMEEHGLITVPDEVSRHDDRKIARRRAGDDEVAEVVSLEEVAPLRVGERLVVPMDQHQVNDERSGVAGLEPAGLGFPKAALYQLSYTPGAVS